MKLGFLQQYNSSFLLQVFNSSWGEKMKKYDTSIKSIISAVILFLKLALIYLRGISNGASPIFFNLLRLPNQYVHDLSSRPRGAGSVTRAFDGRNTQKDSSSVSSYECPSKGCPVLVENEFCFVILSRYDVLLPASCVVPSLLAFPHDMPSRRQQVTPENDQTPEADPDAVKKQVLRHSSPSDVVTDAPSPEIAPLTTLEQLFKYAGPGWGQGFAPARPPFAPPPFPPLRNRLLVCHDLAGGYGEDRLVQGGGWDRAYRMYDWGLIDIFVYFRSVDLDSSRWM